MSDNKQKQRTPVYSNEGIDVTYESFVDSKDKKIEFMKIRVLKDKGNEVKVQYITLSPARYKELILDLAKKLNSSPASAS